MRIAEDNKIDPLQAESWLNLNRSAVANELVCIHYSFIIFIFILIFANLCSTEHPCCNFIRAH